ncbi:hypothetical protein [Candidatus Enterovibrio escicola]|uniref:hypothetical protein n=1 Tax=Candidatus Enterovibrio escicola TaxID=1927127 RepID=UPI000BE37FD9|nr:hypothetical protein [Candidatus Enterovibrio escacola]
MGIPYTLRSVPKEHLTPELYLAVVKMRWLSLNYLPLDFLTYEVSLAVVQKSGHELNDIPNGYNTPELCISAVRQTRDALRYVRRSAFKQEKEPLVS